MFCAFEQKIEVIEIGFVAVEIGGEGGSHTACVEFGSIVCDEGRAGEHELRNAFPIVPACFFVMGGAGFFAFCFDEFLSESGLDEGVEFLPDDEAIVSGLLQLNFERFLRGTALLKIGEGFGCEDFCSQVVPEENGVDGFFCLEECLINFERVNDEN